MNDIDLAFILSDKSDIDGNIGNNSSVGVSDNVGAGDIKSDNIGSNFNTVTFVWGRGTYN